MKHLTRASVVTLALSAISVAALMAQATITPAPQNQGPHAPSSSHSAIIDNGTIQLGVLNEGHLGVEGGTPSLPPDANSTTTVGLRYMPTNGEATAPGCVCEGWGVADAGTGEFAQADVAVGGVQNMSLDSFTPTPSTAVSVVTAFGRLQVTHDYHPTPLTPNLYEAVVTIKNISDTAVDDLRYTRAMDWDIAPNTFSEYVTIQGLGSAANLLYTSANGFEYPNPLDPREGDPAYYVEGNQVDEGPRDHGALFDFGFGMLAAGESKSFRIFYGAAANEPQALAALSAVGAEAYSLGQPSEYGPELDEFEQPIPHPTDTPHTFIFAFTGVGGDPIVPPAITLSPADGINELGAAHELTATILDDEDMPVPDQTVTFTVVSGPNTGLLGVAVTDANGAAKLSYTSVVTGTDLIQASFEDPDSGTLTSNTVSKEWIGIPRVATSLDLTPESATNDVGTVHCVTAVVLDQFSAPMSANVAFAISGAHLDGANVETDANGAATYCYTGTSPGLDAITASVGTLTETVTKTWVPAPGGGCVLTADRWEHRRLSDWPVPSLTLGTVTYGKLKLLKILHVEKFGGALNNLAQALIAAKLNQAAGAAVPADVAAAIAAADALIGDTVVPPIGHGRVRIAPAVPLLITLWKYNHGLIPGGPPACEREHECHGRGGHGHHEGDGCVHGHHGHFPGDRCRGLTGFHHDADGDDSRDFRHTFESR
jgi:hypothetical protein